MIAACVATVSPVTVIATNHTAHAMNNSISKNEEKQTNIINKVSLAYNKPKPNVRPFVLTGTCKGGVSMLQTSKDYPSDEFEFAISAMDNLENVGVIPAEKTRTVKVGSISRVPGKIIAPDEDDFSFDGFELDNL